MVSFTLFLNVLFIDNVKTKTTTHIEVQRIVKLDINDDNKLDLYWSLINFFSRNKYLYKLMGKKNQL